MHRPTCLFWAGLTARSLQMPAAKPAADASGYIGAADVASRPRDSGTQNTFLGAKKLLHASAPI